MKIRRNRPLVNLGEGQVLLEGNPIKYNLKQSARIRGIRLEIRVETGLTVVVPHKYTMRQVEELLNQKSSWIRRHLQADNPHQIPLFKKEPGHGDLLPYMGSSIRLIFRQDGQKPGAAVFEEGILFVNPGHAEGYMPSVLEKWYREQARQVFTGRADFFKGKMGLLYRTIMIRGQRTRWGSCSPTGTITLNWKLLLAPGRVIDYVIIHELSHLKHMNHSRAFWAMVEKYCPRWREERKWLSLHEEELKSLSEFST